MIRRQAIVFAGVAAVALTLAAGSAQALTIENYSGAANGGPANGWTDLNYNDPNKRPPRAGEKRTLNDSPATSGFKFGPSEPSYNMRYNSGDMFSPNYLMGK